MVKVSQIVLKEPIIMGSHDLPYLETDMSDFGHYPCGGLFASQSWVLLLKRKIFYMEKENMKKHLSLKILLALLPTLIFWQNYAWMTGNTYMGIGFLIIWVLMIWNVFQFTEKNHIFERFFRLTEISFFLLPLSALVLTFVIGSRLSSGGSEFEQAGTMVGAAIGGTFITVIAFIVGIAGGIVMHLITRKYEKKAEKLELKQPENLSSKHGVILSVVALIALTIIVGVISSAESATKEAKEKVALSQSLQQGGTPQTDTTSQEPKTNQVNKVSLEIVKKGFYEADYTSGSYQDQITMDLKFTNETDKDMKGVEGTLTFYDIFENQIKTISVGYDKTIPAHQSKVWKSGIDYNQFMDDEVKLKDTELSNLKYKWNVKTIIYSDDSKETF